MNRRFFLLLCLSILVNGLVFGEVRVLYDDTHGQTSGNADWIVTGAYSEMVDLLKSNGFNVISLKTIAPNGRFSSSLLAECEAIILAEPNNPYSPEEKTAIVEFIRNGGGALLIADHGGADRDNDGWDAVKALNSFAAQLGFQFAGDFFYEAPVAGAYNKDHPVMYGIRGVGAWAASTIKPTEGDEGRFTALISSRAKKAAYVAAIESGKGRIVAIGDSSPFDDGVGSGGKTQLHDSYDSFMYSHPQLAYNSMMWICGRQIEKRIPSRVVAFANEAKEEEKHRNLLIDAAHGNAASDKMETFERHMKKLGVKVFYAVTTLSPEMLKKFSLLILPDPSLPILDVECSAVCEWLMAGGRLVVSGDWDSADLANRPTVNNLLTKIGAVIRLNDDQVWDHTNKTNKPWGVLAHVLKQGHPITANVKTAITWGTCSLINRNNKPLTEEAGVEIIISGDDDSFNKDGNKKNDAILYPKGSPIPIMALEPLANGILVVQGCSNFTDYQYPDSDINSSKPGPAPFTHETPLLHDNTVSFLMGLSGANLGGSNLRPRR